MKRKFINSVFGILKQKLIKIVSIFKPCCKVTIFAIFQQLVLLFFTIEKAQAPAIKT